MSYRVLTVLMLSCLANNAWASNYIGVTYGHVDNELYNDQQNNNIIETVGGMIGFNVLNNKDVNLELYYAKSLTLKLDDYYGQLSDVSHVTKALYGVYTLKMPTNPVYIRAKAGVAYNQLLQLDYDNYTVMSNVKTTDFSYAGSIGLQSSGLGIELEYAVLDENTSKISLNGLLFF